MSVCQRLAGLSADCLFIYMPTDKIKMGLTTKLQQAYV